jgi:hypothetical protein
MRPPARLFFTGAALVVAASCYNDAPVAPEGDAEMVVRGNSALQALAVPTSIDLVIPAAGGQVSVLGLYTLTFPANAVCDPDAADSQAGYASQNWDAPCTVATRDVAVRATLKWSYGQLWADFAPALRFVPSKTVTLHTDILAPLVRYYGSRAVGLGLARQWGIGYMTGIEGQMSDDSKSDASVRTKIYSSGRIARRIKHFSGYFIVTGPNAGRPCEPSPDNPWCVWFDVDPEQH